MDPNKPFELSPGRNVFEEAEKKMLKMFSSRIKESFLKKIYKAVWENPLDIYRYFDMNPTLETIAAGISDSSPNYEVCRNIVSIHRFNCVGLSDQDRAKDESSQKYCDKLIEQVSEQIRIRAFAGAFFRRKRITSEEDYIFFPPAYKLFAICQRARQILLDYHEDDRQFIAEIFGKIMSALILMEDGFLANAYPSARAAIELYLRWLVLLEAPEAGEMQRRLSDIQLLQFSNDGEYPDELKDAYYNEAKHKTGMLSYMNFGWVDAISDYEVYVQQKHYSIDGLLTYLKNKWMAMEGNTDVERSFYQRHFDLLKILYSRCHAYTHANITSSNYSLLEFTDLTVMLAMVGRHTYAALAEHANVSPNIVAEAIGLNEDILSSLDKDRTKLHWIFENKTEEVLKTFHNYKK